MNNLPAMTEAQRTEIIELCTSAINETPNDDEVVMHLIAQIALAALTAERKPKGRTMPRHEFAQMVNELRAVPSVQSKREIIVRILHAFNINPDKPE